MEGVYQNQASKMVNNNKPVAIIKHASTVTLFKEVQKSQKTSTVL